MGGEERGAARRALACAGEVLCRRGGRTEAARWVYRVVCADGALVRAGLELTSALRHTLALHSLVEISERRMNDQGLARLRTADGRGWLSEQLNPLSGHRGPIVTLVPLPTVLAFAVGIPEGALVRQTCELSSPQVRLVPEGETVRVVAKRFSDHPASRCIPRLQLADGTGWISLKLNRPPPHDALVVKLVGAEDEVATKRLEAMRLERVAREEGRRAELLVERRGRLEAQLERAKRDVAQSLALAADGGAAGAGGVAARLAALSLTAEGLGGGDGAALGGAASGGGDNGLFCDQGGDRDCVVCLAADRTVRGAGKCGSMGGMRRSTRLFSPQRTTLSHVLRSASPECRLLVSAGDHRARGNRAHRVLHGVRTGAQSKGRPVPGVPNGH